MPIEPELFDDAAGLGRHLASDILALLEARAGSGLVLGCPAGRSLLPTYRALAGLVQMRGGIDARLTVVMMDEYLSAAAPPTCADPRLPHSCLGFAQRELEAPLAPLMRGGVDLKVPDPAAPAAYDELLADLGGIDLFLLASGASDGHVAFNPPGSPRDSRSRIIELPATTRQDNLQTFPGFGALANVPTHGVSVGIDTIARHSRRAVMVLTGPAKTAAAERILATGDYEPDWPSTVVHVCQNPRIMLDRAAAQASTNR